MCRAIVLQRADAFRETQMGIVQQTATIAATVVRAWNPRRIRGSRAMHIQTSLRALIHTPLTYLLSFIYNRSLPST